MFEKLIDSILCGLKDILGKEYISNVVPNELPFEINTNIDYLISIKESEKNKVKKMTYDKRSRIQTESKVFDLLIQYKGKVNDTELEQKILNYILKTSGELSYINDRRIIFKQITKSELRTEIQLILITFAINSTTIK